MPPVVIRADELYAVRDVQVAARPGGLESIARQPDPNSDLPTLAERDRFCQRPMAEHLGFTPAQTLSGRMRKLADRYRKQRGRSDLFAQD